MGLRVRRGHEVELKIRFVFDGKGSQVDNVEREFEAITAGIRDWAKAAAGPAYIPPMPEPDPLWKRATAGARNFLAVLLALVALAVIAGGISAAARLGWEWTA